MPEYNAHAVDLAIELERERKAHRITEVDLAIELERERKAHRITEVALAKVVAEVNQLHELSYRCQAWIDGGQCPQRATMMLQFTTAIAVRVDVCVDHYTDELDHRQGDR